MRFSTALRCLVFGLPLFIVSFAVVMAGAALARAAGDALAAGVLNGVGLGLGIMTLVDLTLLVGLLGFQATCEQERRARWRQRRRQRRKR